MIRLFRSPEAVAGSFGVLSFVVRLPFVFRYDLHFGADSAISYLMALRITQGDRPLYFYGQDYQGALEAYIAAVMLKIAGPSIPAAALVSLVEWSIAAAIATYLIVRGTNVFAGVICGLVTAVGVPYTLHYVTVPYWGYPGSLLIGMLLLLEAFLIIDKGPSVRRWFIFGLTIGLGLYVGKQSLPGIVASVLALAASRSLLEKTSGKERAVMFAAGLAGFVAGYSPEIWYRLHASGSRSFAAIANPGMVWTNLTAMLASLPAYFDGQPVSRMPESTYFFTRPVDPLIAPDGIVDWLHALTAIGAIGMACLSLRRPRTRGEAALLLLAALVFVNIAAVVLSAESDGRFLNTRRYLYPSAVAFSVWAGVLWAAALQQNRIWIRAAGLAFGVLFAGRILFHEIVLLQSPDELRELRQIVAGMSAEGVNYGVAPWGSSTLNALTNQRITFALRDDDRFPDNAEAVARSDEIAVIGPKGDPVEEIRFAGILYRPAGPSHDMETLTWTRYRKSPSP